MKKIILILILLLIPLVSAKKWYCLEHNCMWTYEYEIKDIEHTVWINILNNDTALCVEENTPHCKTIYLPVKTQWNIMYKVCKQGQSFLEQYYQVQSCIIEELKNLTWNYNCFEIYNFNDRAYNECIDELNYYKSLINKKGD